MNPPRIRFLRNFLLPTALLMLGGCAGGGWSGSAPPASPAPTGVYLLRPGDIVLLEVFQEPYMTTRQKILEDGSINVGLVGPVRIAGESVPAASAKVLPGF